MTREVRIDVLVSGVLVALSAQLNNSCMRNVQHWMLTKTKRGSSFVGILFVISLLVVIVVVGSIGE